MLRLMGPVGLPTVGGLVAGLTRDVGDPCPRAGILSGGVFSCTFGRSRPRPRLVLLPEGRETHQTDGASSQADTGF